MKRFDDSVPSANTPIAKNKFYDYEHGIFKCMVMRVHYTDEETNLTQGAKNPQVTYDVIVIGGKREGHIFNNVRDASALGGQYNYHEKIWRAASEPSFVKSDGGKEAIEQDGDIVFVAFVDGVTDAPVILGGGTSPLDEDQTGATKEDGPRMLFEYNGVNVLIDKDGQLFVTRKKGEQNPDLETFVPNEEEDPHVKVKFEGEIVELEDDNGNIVTIDSENQKITICSVKEIELKSDVIKMIAESEFRVETKTVNIETIDYNLNSTNVNVSATDTNIDSTNVNVSGSQTNINSGTTAITGTTLLGGGGPGVARLGDRSIGSGNHGKPVISTIVQSSSRVFSS